MPHSVLFCLFIQNDSAIILIFWNSNEVTVIVAL